MSTRRKFIGQTIAGSLITASGKFPFSISEDDPDLTTLTIVHTNDVHSRIDPFPMDGSRNAGLGGAAKRAQMISDIRKKEDNVLLLDSGDIFQGTPYFNFFGGELEMKLMTEMAYDAATMGNHDFDAGLEGFEKQMKHAQFPFIVSNYDFSDTLLSGKIQKHKVIEKDGIKVGILGLGIDLEGLVPPKLYANTIYNDPITEAQKQADILKEELKCDYVICLSHLGFKYRNNPNLISDMILAERTSNIDLILGGHTHTFLRKPVRVKNKLGKEVNINQCGWGGILLGKIQVHFERNKKNKCITCKNKLVK